MAPPRRQRHPLPPPIPPPEPPISRAAMRSPPPSPPISPVEVRSPPPSPPISPSAVRSPPPSPPKTAPPSQTPSVTGDTGGEIAVPLVDSLGISSGRTAVPSVGSIGISMAPVTGDIGISDLDEILKFKDQTISTLEEKVRTNEKVFEKFKQRIKENTDVISAIKKEVDTKNEKIINLNASVCILDFDIENKDRHIDWLENRISRVEKMLELAEEKLVEKDLEIGVESRIQHLEHENTASTDDIVRQFNDLSLLGEMRLKEKAKFADLERTLDFLSEENSRLDSYIEEMRRSMSAVKDRETILEEEQRRIFFKHEVIITCYAGAYKEMKAWFKERCKEMDEFFKRQHDMLDS